MLASRNTLRSLSVVMREGDSRMTRRRSMHGLLMVSFIILGASGCGTQVPLYRAAANASVNNAAFQGSGVNPGVILPWHNRVYELVDTVNSHQAGPMLGHMRYYGALNMRVTVFAWDGHPTSRGIVFQTDNGKLFKALRAKPLGGPPLTAGARARPFPSSAPQPHH